MQQKNNLKIIFIFINFSRRHELIIHKTLTQNKQRIKKINKGKKIILQDCSAKQVVIVFFSPGMDTPFDVH